VPRRNPNKLAGRQARTFAGLCALILFPFLDLTP
jgi:hypothetical protein